MSTPPTAANIGAALVAADALFPFESAEAHEMTRVLATGAKAYDRLAQIIYIWEALTAAHTALFASNAADAQAAAYEVLDVSNATNTIGGHFKDISGNAISASAHVNSTFATLKEKGGFSNSNYFFGEISYIVNVIPARGAATTLKSPSMKALPRAVDVTLAQLKAVFDEVAMGLLKGCQRCAPLIKGQEPIPAGQRGFDQTASRRFVWNLS